MNNGLPSMLELLILVKFRTDMADKTKIEWTDATWNPVSGCSHVSEGCRFCYAERESKRWGHTNLPWTKENSAVNVEFHQDRLQQPLRWKRPRRIFVNSMSDLFHEQIDLITISEIFGVMAASSQHTFQVLTKRPERMQTILAMDTFRELVRIAAIELNDMHDDVWPLPNVWLGVSVEDQRTADERIPILLQTPAALRFISAEPLLAGITIEPYLGIQDEDGHDFPGLNWVIAGGESGPHARPSHPDLFRRLRDECQEYQVPFFFKQWGEWAPVSLFKIYRESRLCFVNRYTNEAHEFEENPGIGFDRESTMIRAGKKYAGNILDGRKWDEFPLLA